MKHKHSALDQLDTKEITKGVNKIYAELAQAYIANPEAIAFNLLKVMALGIGTGAAYLEVLKKEKCLKELNEIVLTEEESDTLSEISRQGFLEMVSMMAPEIKEQVDFMKQFWKIRN